VTAAAAAAGLTSVVAHAAVGIARPLGPLSDTDYKNADHYRTIITTTTDPPTPLPTSGKTFLRRRYIVV